MFRLDDLALVSMAAYTLLTLITVACAPRGDLGQRQRASLATVFAGTLLAYAAGNSWVFLAGWCATVWPTVWGFNPSSRGPRIALGASMVALAAGLFLAAFVGGPVGHTGGFLATILAVLLRKGIFPFHSWVATAFEHDSLPHLNLLLNSHLGAYLMIRFAVSLFPDLASETLSLLGGLAIFTSIYTALLAIVAARPRRILALLSISQASFILAGLENRNVEGITGALVHWWVVAFATTALLAIYRSLEARTTEVGSPTGFLGLGYHAPRLGVFFTIAVLALVGLPGTLGFVAEDLLFHGSLESHPLLGIGLPLATALNAITGLRLMATLFLGKRGLHVAAISDALPRERWALTLPVVLLVAGGLAPGIWVALRTPSAESIARALAGR